MDVYRITDLTSDYEFEIVMSEETYKALKTIRSELGYVMEDILIEKVIGVND